MHYSGFINKFQYKLPYVDIFGGIVAFTANQFESVNGYSNEYWGWGGEDDDLYRRQETLMKKSGATKILRPDKNIYRYRMIHHDQERLNPKNPKRFHLLNNWKFHQAIDGLSVSFDLQKANGTLRHSNLNCRDMSIKTNMCNS